MIRNSFIIASVFALVGPAALAQDATPPKSLEEINNARVAALTTQAAQLYTDASTEPNPQVAAQMRRDADDLYARAEQSKGKADGMVGRMNQVEAQIANDKQRLDDQKDMYGKPSFWDKIGDKAIDTGWGLLDSMIQKWLDGGGEDDDLLNQINSLQDERDRLINERDNPAAGSGMGRIITDPNGTYGYDRDGDGFVDVPLNPDGTPAGNNSSNDFDDFGDNLAGLGGLPLNSGGGGGASFGGGGGGPGFGGIGAGGIDGATGGEGLAAGGEDGEGAFPGASASDDDADLDGANAAKSGGDGETDDQGREIENIMGRVVILPKVEDEANIAGKEEESSDWSDDFEEWGDDDWDDGADNGDKKSGDDEDWAEPKLVGDGEKEAKLVEELIRVQSIIEGWQDDDSKDEDAEEDPYGFNDDDMSGYQEPGEKEDKDEDLFKDVRDEDGKIDITKVDIWVIDRDSWKEGKTPIRYKVKAPLDLKDFDPIPGGVLVARGVVEELDVKDSVMKTIKGEVKKLEIVSVILSAEKPPEDMDSLDPSKTEDSDVGGLEEDELGDGFEDDSDW